MTINFVMPISNSIYLFIFSFKIQDQDNKCRYIPKLR